MCCWKAKPLKGPPKGWENPVGDRNYHTACQHFTQVSEYWDRSLSDLTFRNLTERYLVLKIGHPFWFPTGRGNLKLREHGSSRAITKTRREMDKIDRDRERILEFIRDINVFLIDRKVTWKLCLSRRKIPIKILNRKKEDTRRTIESRKKQIGRHKSQKALVLRKATAWMSHRRGWRKDKNIYRLTQNFRWMVVGVYFLSATKQ